MPSNKCILLSIGPLKAKVGFLESVMLLEKLGFTIYATQGIYFSHLLYRTL